MCVCDLVWHSGDPTCPHTHPDTQTLQPGPSHRQVSHSDFLRSQGVFTGLSCLQPKPPTLFGGFPLILLSCVHSSSLSLFRVTLQVGCLLSFSLALPVNADLRNFPLSRPCSLSLLPRSPELSSRTHFLGRLLPVSKFQTLYTLS